MRDLNQVSRDVDCEHGITFLVGNGLIRCGQCGDAVGVDIVQTIRIEAEKYARRLADDKR